MNDYRTSRYANLVTLQHTQLTASLGEPLLYREELIGAITVSHEGGRCFTGEDQELVRLFATQAAIAIENARLYDTALRRGEELEALLRATRSIMSGLDLEGILAEAAAMVGTARVRVTLVDRAVRLLRVARVTGGLVAPGTEYPLENLSGLVVTSGELVFSPQVATDPRAHFGSRYAEFGIVTYLGLPIKIRGEVIGILIITTTASREYPPEELAYLTSFADCAAIAIENARLHEATSHRAQQFASLNELTRALTTDLDPYVASQRILTAAQTLIPASAGRLWEYPGEGETLRLVGDSGFQDPEGGQAFRLRLGEGLVGISARTRQPVISSAVTRDPRFLDQAWAESKGLVASIVLPLLHGERVTGFLSIFTRAPHDFIAEEVELLRSFAAQAAIATENARLYQQEQVRRKELEAVRSVSEEITREMDLTALLRLILERAVELADGDTGVLYLWSEDTQRLIPKNGHGYGEWVAEVRLRLEEGVSGTVAARRQGLIVNDFRSSPYATPLWLGRSRQVAALSEPLLYRDRLVGVITISREDSRCPFTAEDQRLLRLFVTQAAIAIENARLFAELNESYAQVQQAQEELVRSEKLRGLGQMAAGIAHDLNNMLAAILGQVELLKLRGAPPDVRDGLATLETAASDGAQVVHRLQDFARQRAASPLAPMDLAPAVHEALEITRPRWQDELQQRGKTIAIHAALGDLPLILGHAPEIREVLTNLIFNAVDAMPDGGRLTLAGAATLSGVTLTLTDTGVGMAEDVRQKIFEPFFTTKGVRGTGLGLAVVYSILERHGGRVAVASAPGQGTTVTLTFQASAAGLAAPAVAPPLRPASRRLLLIDDEPLVRTILGSLLRAMGHTVTEAASGADGLATLAAHPVDCVLTDLGMPEMTGWDVARAVRAQHPLLPIVLLTGWGEQAPGDVAEMPLADRVLGKPVRLEELLDTIAELTPETPRPKP